MMTERQRLERKKFLEELEAEERAAEEKRTRPIREVEAQINETARKLHETVRDRVLTQKDNEAYLDPAVATARMTKAQAEQFNGEQARIFVQNNPDYFRCPENFAALTEYLTRQGHSISTAEMFKRAWLRLRSLHLIKEWPEPESEPEPTIQREPEQPQQTGPQVYEGIDLETGSPRLYTQREVDLMSADEFRRKMNISVTRGLEALFERR